MTDYPRGTIDRQGNYPDEIEFDPSDLAPMAKPPQGSAMILVSGTNWQLSWREDGSYLLETWNKQALWRIELTQEQADVYLKGVHDVNPLDHRRIAHKVTSCP